MLKREDKIALERYLDKIAHIQKYNNVNLNESDIEKKKRIERAKKDYAFCVKYYFPHYASAECADFQIEAANCIRRHKDCIDVEAWPRGHGKSVHMDIMIPFWLWINNDLHVMLLVGNNEDAAKILLSDLQAEFESNPQILADFGLQKQLGGWEEGNFVTKNGCAFFSLGRGQSPRGVRHRNKRPDYIVLDDLDDDQLVQNPRRVKKAVKWIFAALLNTMDNTGARMIFAGNIIAPNSIITNVIKRHGVRANIIRAVQDNGEPAWHQKYTKEFFEERRRVIGDFAFQTEFMNNPQIEGEIFKDEQIQWCKLPRIDTFECIVGHWDVAYAGTPTSDYNAVRVWGLKDGCFYLIKCFVRQCKMDQAIRWMIEYQKSLPQSVMVHWRFESQFWNDALKMILREVEKETKSTLPLIQTDRPVKNKFDRIVSLQPYYQNGKIFYNKAEEYNNDMVTGLNQLKGIEPGYSSHDDAPDADEGAISYLSKHIKSHSPLPIIGIRKSPKSLW